MAYVTDITSQDILRSIQEELRDTRTAKCLTDDEYEFLRRYVLEIYKHSTRPAYVFHRDVKKHVPGEVGNYFYRKIHAFAYWQHAEEG